jgi:glycerophosphoryl diester phosphodiesterase
VTRRRTNLGAGFALVAILASVSCGGSLRRADAGSQPLPHGVLIAHALGEIDGDTYTNSQAAAERSYGFGNRWFEVDLALTADGDLVTFHEGLENRLGVERPISALHMREVLAHRFDGRYAITTLAALLRRFADVDDAYLVTDSKRWTPEILSAMLRGLDAVPAMRARVVPQIYHPTDLSVLNEARDRWPWPTLIFTLYQAAMSADEVVSFVSRNDIPVVAMPIERFNASFASRLHDAGAKVLVHTVDDPGDAARLAREGADGFFTDSLHPEPNLASGGSS